MEANSYARYKTEVNSSLLRTYVCGAAPWNEGEAAPYRIWRDEARLGTPVNGRSIEVELLPLSQFLKLFYHIAYDDGALVIGHNLPFGLARLASSWHEVKKGENVGGWKLALWTYHDPKTRRQQPSAGWRPYIILKRAAPNVTFIEFTGRRGSTYRGEFLDLANLARALTGRQWTFAEALKAFAGELVDQPIEDGRITPDRISYCRCNVHATVKLGGALVGLFDRLHPVSRYYVGGYVSETRRPETLELLSHRQR